LSWLFFVGSDEFTVKQQGGTTPSSPTSYVIQAKQVVGLRELESEV